MTDLEQLVTDLEVKVNTLSISVGSHLAESSSLEDTLRNIDNTVNQIKVDIEKGKLEAHLDIEKALDPVYELLRKNSENSFKDTVKLLKDYFGTLSGILVLVFALSGYIYKNDLDHAKRSNEVIINLINKHVLKFEKIHPQKD